MGVLLLIWVSERLVSGKRLFFLITYIQEYHKYQLENKRVHDQIDKLLLGFPSSMLGETFQHAR